MILLMKKVNLRDKKTDTERKIGRKGQSNSARLPDGAPNPHRDRVDDHGKAKIIKSMELHDLGGYRIGNDYFLFVPSPFRYRLH